MPNWMPSLYPGGRARLIPRRISFNASRRSAGSAARYSLTVDADMRTRLPREFLRGQQQPSSRGGVRPDVVPTSYFLLYPAVTVNAGMGQLYHPGFCWGNRNVRLRLPSLD